MINVRVIFEFALAWLARLLAQCKNISASEVAGGSRHSSPSREAFKTTTLHTLIDHIWEAWNDDSSSLTVKVRQSC